MKLCAPIRQVFTTVHPGQGDIALLLYRGDAHVASRNRLLGQFHLVGLPPAPVGVPQIEVSAHS
jgi:molecular chaperone DnaK